jgi:thioredoxin reductase
MSSHEPGSTRINRRGLFAAGVAAAGGAGVAMAGDVRHGSVKRVASAVGEGSVAVQLVHALRAPA